MARLVDCAPGSDDELPEVSTVMKKATAVRKDTSAFKSPTKTSPVKNLVPKSTVKPSARKVRRLGDGKGNLDNPLFKKWNADEDDGNESMLRGSPTRSPRKQRLQSQRQASNLTQMSFLSEYDPDMTAMTTRTARSSRLKTTFDMDEDSIEESSTDMLRTLPKVRGIRQPGSRSASQTSADASSVDGVIDVMEADEPEETPDAQLLMETSMYAPEANNISVNSEEISIYEAADEDFSDGDDDDGSDFEIQVSPSKAGKRSPSKLLFSKPRGDQSISALASFSKDVPILKPRHPNLKTPGSPSEHDKSITKSDPFDSTILGGDENKVSFKSKTQATAADLADNLSKLRLEFEEDDTKKVRNGDSDESFSPPNTPPKMIKTKSLVSPTKAARIPKTPHRPSMDPFWSQDLVDDWNEEHSPRKMDLTNVTKSTFKMSPSKAAKRAFEAKKHGLAEKFLRELDGEITQGKIAELAESTGGVKLVWTKTLSTTAGRANWRRETIRTKQADGTETSVRHKHHASIELAEKVIDNEDRLLNVLAHEFCHLANFMVNGITNNPHGREFKSWAVKCSQKFSDRGVKVTTKHTYDIDFKYVWSCGACGAEYKRHSRSIDPARHRCGTCKGELKQTRPVPRGAGAGAAAAALTAKQPTEYQKFMKEQMKVVKAEHPELPQREIMKMVAEKWAKRNQGKESKEGESRPSTSGGSVEESGDKTVDAMVDKIIDLTLSENPKAESEVEVEAQKAHGVVES